jgi:hypothetical protein
VLHRRQHLVVGPDRAICFISSTSRVRRTPPVETVETKRRPVPASAVSTCRRIFHDDDARDEDCAVARCLAMSSSSMRVRPISMLYSCSRPGFCSC